MHLKFIINLDLFVFSLCPLSPLWLTIINAIRNHHKPPSFTFVDLWKVVAKQKHAQQVAFSPFFVVKHFCAMQMWFLSQILYNLEDGFCHNLHFGLATKTRVWKGMDQECNLIITFTLLRMWESVREWAHTLPSGFPFWEFESLWGPYWVSMESQIFKKAIKGVKTHWIEDFLIPLERF
jgi:hypothetical protein